MTALKDMQTFQVGDLVRATAGREDGGLFIVWQTDGRYVILCDGKTRKIAGAKRKNSRHVISTGLKSERIAAARLAEPPLMLLDADIRKEINSLREEVL